MLYDSIDLTDDSCRLLIWNFTSSENPQVSLDDNMGGKGAQYFFSQIASYAKAENYKHVIYELCGEPGSENWTNIKDFASAVIPSIQTNDEGALMIVATPQWCQLIEAAVDKEVAKGAYKDVLLYSFHYSACSHLQFLPKLKSVSTSLPVVVSEWTAQVMKLWWTVNRIFLSVLLRLMTY